MERPPTDTLKELWELGTGLECPYQRYVGIVTLQRLGIDDWGIWVSERTPPCHLKVCNKDGCHNYGTKFKGKHGRSFSIIQEEHMTLLAKLRSFVGA